MLTTDQAQELIDSSGNVVDTDGNKIGGLGQLFLDDQTGTPEWVTVKTGMFGPAESFVPLREAELSGSDVQVPYDKDKVKNAPRIDDPTGHLSEDEEDTLYSYYGIDDSSSTQSGLDDLDDLDDQTVGHDTSGPTTDEAMTRSEEQLQVSKQTREAGRVRLRKHVVTENVTQTVPVSHEEFTIEREPITDANRSEALEGGDITSEEHEIVLNEEQIVVEKDVVPVERVKLGKETVTSQEQVEESVRKEQIDMDGDDQTTSDR